LSGHGDSLVGGGDDFSASTAGELGQRDQPIGRDLAARGPGDAFYRVSPCSIAISASPWDLMPTFKPALPVGGFLAQHRLASNAERRAACGFITSPLSTRPFSQP
jgi:hypothetical protein